VRKFIFLFAVLSFFLIARPAFGYHYQEVLGSSDELSIPPTVEGPGIVLPDSPFFFLDQIKQNVRVLFALSSEDKARVHAAIAGERMAELRYMLTRSNSEGINTALDGLNQNFKYAADNLSQAKFSGRDVALLSKQINDQIKEKLNVLKELESDTKGELKLSLNVVSQGLFESKVRIEEGLNEADLKNEIRDDINWKTERDLRVASDSAAELRMSLEDLKIEATSAANSSLKARQQMLELAIQEKNTELQREQQRLMEQEKLRQYQITKLNESAMQDAAAIVEKAKAVSEKFGQMKLGN
jgi:hypothetical protein